MCEIEKVDLKALKWNDQGLIPAIVQDGKDGTVLMLAYMNMEALRKTFETGRAFFWSRSRKKLWAKGETSGHIQRVHEIRIDCDLDTVLLRVDQEGGACHEGYRTCFFRRLDRSSGALDVVETRMFDPKKVYGA